MRVFLSGCGNFTLAVPIEYVESIMIYHGNEDSNNKYISLPKLFKHQNIDTHHGIVIKNSNCILLTTRVDSETDIPKKEIFSVPKVFNVLQFSIFFSGIKITENQLILILNPDKLIKNIKEEIL